MQMGTFTEVKKFLHKLDMLPRATKRVPLISETSSPTPAMKNFSLPYWEEKLT